MTIAIWDFLGVSVKQVSGRCPACRAQTWWIRNLLIMQIGQYLLDNYRALNAGNHLHRAATFTTGLDVDIEHAL